MTLPPRLAPQTGPHLWTAADLTLSDFMLPLGAEAAADMQAALAGLGGRAPRTADEAPLPSVAPLLRQVAERLESGRGFVLLRGLSFPPEQSEAALLLLAAHLGTALPQDTVGTLVARPEPAPPATDGAVRFHADPADAVGLLCQEQAEVSLLSAAALHNALLLAGRDALATLYQPLPHQGAAGQRHDLPVFGLAGGTFAARHDRDAIPDDELAPPQREALAALEATAAAPALAFTLALHAGDLLFHNPHVVWRRQGWAAGSAPLLRLWLAMPNSRALPEAFRAIFGETAAGAHRGGAASSTQMVGG